MRQYVILKTIEHFERMLEEETGDERKASLRKLIQREYEKLHAETEPDAAKSENLDLSEPYQKSKKRD
ncbi:hypothetical protein GCM10010924_59430 [Rhizobium wenxiniae]|nr:hypothetical protein GCM10010924_59430 [Rhizobium wenxiniae]